MSTEKDGGNTPRAVDLKALDPHYIMPANIKGDLEDLFDAVSVVGLLTEASDREDGPVIGGHDFAALHRSLSLLGKRLLAEVPAVFPTLRDVSAL